MSSLKLDLIHAFGSTCARRYQQCVAICEQDKNEAKVAFPVGKAMAKKSIDRSEMTFVPFADDTQQIENICILPTRAHVAVAYRHPSSNLQMIKIYSFSKEEEPISIQIFHENQKQSPIRLMVFSPSEPKFMCALLGQPHNKLLFVDTFKNKALAESSFTLKDIDQISICPFNSHLICVTGGSSIKLFKVEEYTFKPLEEVRRIPKGRRITTHAWYKKKMILVATDRCQLLVLEEVRPNLYQIKQEYYNVFNEPPNEPLLITALCPFTKGIILGSNNGKFCLWTKKQDGSLQGQECLQLSRKWSTTQERASEVTNINIGLKQDIIVISLANNDIATLYINELIPQVSDLINDITDKEIVFQYIYKGFHNSPITGMDICEQRPLVATCSNMDSTIRIWNYKSFGCKLLRMFYFKMKEEFQTNNPLISLAFHPSGYYLAVACVDKLRLFHVLNNQLRPYREIGVRNAHLIKFSKGGHLLAIAYPLRDEVDINHIKIFNALTLQQIITLKDHTSMVKSLEFKNYDENLLSVSEQGSLIEWKLSDWTKSKNFIKKQMRYKSCIYWHSRNSIIAFGCLNGKNYIQEYNCDNSSLSQHQLDAQVVTMAELNIGKEKGLALCLENGKIIVFGGLQRPIVMDCKNIHIGKANNIVLSPCGRYVITSSQDCLILIFKLYHQVDGIIQSEDNSNIIVDDFLADVVMINRKEIQKISDKEKQYSKVIGSLSKKLRLLTDERLRKHKNKMVEVEVQKNRIIDDVNYRIERLRNQVEQLKGKSQSSLETLDNSHLGKAQSIEQSFEEKINFQIQKYFQLEQELIHLKLMHKQEIESMKRVEEGEIVRMKNEFQNKFKDSQNIYSDSKKESERATTVFDDRLKQIEDEQEDQVRQIQSKKHKFKLETVAALEDLFEKQKKLKKEHSRLTGQRNQEKQRNEQRISSRRKTEKEVQEARQKLRDMVAEYNQKIEVLKVKERRILEFENKISQLQKKKHILSYKGTQMKKAMEPKELQIDKMKIDLIKLKKEFEVSLQRKQKSTLLLEKSQKEKINLEKLLNEEKKETEKEVDTFDKIMGDIYHCIQTYEKVGDVKIFYKEFIKLYHKFINKNDKVEQVAGSKGLDELTRQVMHLEKSLFQITKSNQKNVLRKNDEIFKRIKENTELVTNLNDIKKQNKELILKIKSKKEEIDRLRIAKNGLLSECKNVDNSTYKMFLQDQQDQKNIKASRTSLVRQSANKNSVPGGSKQHEVKKSFQKMQNQLVSEIEFMSEKSQKMDFYIRDMKDKIKKHLVQFKCSPDVFIQDSQFSDV